MDESFSSDLDRIGIGMCLRNGVGAFIQAKTAWMSPMVPVPIGEAFGLLQARSWFAELGL